MYNEVRHESNSLDFVQADMSRDVLDGTSVEISTGTTSGWEDNLYKAILFSDDSGN